MKILTVAAVFLALAWAKPNALKEVPQLSLRSWASRSDAPTVDITFVNGIKDTLILHRHFTGDVMRRSGKMTCNFLGHLKNEPEACVALTGCPGEEKVSITLFSNNNHNHFMYEWHQDGTVEGIDSAFKDGTSWGEGILAEENKDGLPIVDIDRAQEPPIQETKAQNEHPEHPEYNAITDEPPVAEPLNAYSRMATIAEENCHYSSTNDKRCDKMPTGMKLTMRMFYTTPLKAKVETENDRDPVDFINEVLTHTQAHFCLFDSLGTRIKVELLGDIEYRPDLNITATSDSLKVVREIASEDNTADLLSFYTSEEKYGGTSGIAYLNQVCGSSTNRNRVHIVEWRKAMSTNAEVVAHEMAHNMAVRHDHDSGSHTDKYMDKENGTVIDLGNHKSQGCNVGDKEGFMTYGPGTKWSPCTAFDVLQDWRGDSTWCMETITPEEACGPQPREFGNLLLAAGYPANTKVEVIDLDEGQSCNANYGDFPTDEYNWPMYAYIPEKETVLACGGDTTDEFEKKCYEFTASGLAESATVLESNRQAGYGIARNGELYMIGGWVDDGSDVTLMEHAAPGGTVSSGPSLESANYGPCVVSLDDSSILMVGGYTTSDVSSYNFDTDTWTAQAPLAGDRCYHDCALLKDQSGDGQYVVAGGGYSYDGSDWSKVDRVEVYNIADNTWFTGPDLPASQGYPRMATSVDGKSVFLTGIENKVYRFECTGKECEWIDHGVELEINEREAHISAIVPDSFCSE